MKLGRKILYSMSLLVCCSSILIGCGNKEERIPNNKKTVENVLKEQIKKEEQETKSSTETKNQKEKTITKQKVEGVKEEKATTEQKVEEVAKEKVTTEKTIEEVAKEKVTTEQEVKEKKATTEQKVEEVAKEKVTTKQKKEQKSKTKENVTKVEKYEETKQDKQQENKVDKIDYDLTKMNPDMVYATIYQMMIDPDSYIGKKIKMKGLYYASYNELNDKYYHFVVVADAAACCSQGIEFIWDKGQHIYPDEYPLDETEVEVIGIFEGYQEEGEKNTYYRLKNSTFHIVK